MPAARAPKKYPTSPTSGVRLSRYALIRRCMQAYLSPILVDSILAKSMAACGAAERENTDELLPELVEHSLSGLRLFVDPARLPELVARLRVLAGPEK
jgi:hypothetical protein